jgi:hypothetical protein
MLYLLAEKDAKIYVNGSYQEVKEGGVIWVQAPTYFLLQHGKGFKPLSSKLVKGAWVYMLEATRDGKDAINGRITEYKKGDIVETNRAFVRSLLLKWFVWHKSEIIPTEEVVETPVVVVEETPTVEEAIVETEEVVETPEVEGEVEPFTEVAEKANNLKEKTKKNK